ncbi:helix-turn-helix domain-containing protein [Hymenobacter sp. H14-R3]|uniref:helix-turn-helix domain-containing protein n=1 Tax=Hymenobacter sp. H14-R3 TaxID=3046308 RepID=UPI0024B9396B|nr:helix-turn-helix domain-containing protein [Hymenobacter sp. H14-R3]MDJ0367646.1 helix-turn-helix domain-containing protein [Hymenobacter sp. H14-R3]
MDTIHFLLMPRLAKPVHLPPADAAQLRAIVKKGTHKSRKIARARALLAMSSGKGAATVQAEVGISTTQYYRLKGRYLAGGLAQALEERPRSGQPPKVTPALEARITSLTCSDLPAGAARWTLSLLSQTLVSLNYGPAVSKETIRQVLKKASSSPG